MRASRPQPLRLSRRRLLVLAGAVSAAGLIGPPPFIARAAGDPAVQAPPGGLPNGLTVIVEERPSADTVALQYTTLAGSRDDGDAPGSTVLTSRMLLQGTPRYPSEIALQRAATLLGGSLARGTTAEYSSIASVMPADAAETAFDLVADAVINPLLDRTAFNGQIKVALQDLAQRQSTPAVLISDLFQQSIFAGQPLGRSPLGTPDSIAALTLDTIQANRARLWGAANTVLTVVGRITAQQALDLANQFFARLFTGAANVRQPTQALAPASPVTIEANAGQQIEFRLGFTAPSLRDDDRYPIAVLTGMLSGFAGRLLRELRTNLGISYTPSAGYVPFSDAGAWFATAAVDPDKLDQALDVTRAQIEDIRDVSAADSEVSDAISAIAGEEILASESNASVATQLAVQRTLGDVSTDEFVRRVQQVTPADVQRVAQTYLDLDHSLTVLVGPLSS